MKPLTVYVVVDEKGEPCSYYLGGKKDTFCLAVHRKKPKGKIRGLKVIKSSLTLQRSKKKTK